MYLELVGVLLILQGEMLFGCRELLTVLQQLVVLQLHLLQILRGALIRHLSQSGREGGR